MQELLNGFDVSKVFNKQDSDYYEFKPEIESKESIREFIDTAESEMNAYLQELGYIQA